MLQSGNYVFFSYTCHLANLPDEKSKKHSQGKCSRLKEAEEQECRFIIFPRGQRFCSPEADKAMALKRNLDTVGSVVLF